MDRQQSRGSSSQGERAALSRTLGLTLVAVLLAGCAQVRPKADYERARQWVTESTGAGDVYDPEAPGLTDLQMDAYLMDGLTLEEAVRITLLNNRRLHAEFLSIGVAKADWVQAGLFENPAIGLSAQYPEGGGVSNLQASIAQNIVDLWQIPKRKRAAQADLDATVLRIAYAATTLVTQTKEAYFQAVAADESLRLAEANLKVTAQSHDAIKIRRQAGAASDLDENLARGQVLSAEIGVRSARLAAANAKRRLAGQMCIARTIDKITLTDPLLSEIGPLDAERLVEVARKRRLDLRALEAVAQARLADLGVQKRGVFPDVSAGAMFQRNERRDADTGAIKTILGPSLSMALPLFDQNQAQIAKAQYLYWQEIKRYEAEYLQAIQEIRTAVDQAQTALANTAYYQQEVVPQAERSLEFSRDSYLAGQTSILTLLEAQRSLLESRRGDIAVRLELATAIFELEQRVGEQIGRDPAAAGVTSKPADNVPPDTAIGD